MGTTLISSPVDAFRAHAQHAVESMSGPDAVEAIVQLYRSEAGAHDARVDAAGREASAAAGDARQQHAMLEQTHRVAAHGVWAHARISAELSGCRTALERLRRLAEQSDTGTVGVPEMLAELSMEPDAPVYQPTILAFHPDARFRAGVFASHDRSETLTLTFIGYALVDYGPGAQGCIESVFLVGDRALPRGVVQAEKALQFERLLPA